MKKLKAPIFTPPASAAPIIAAPLPAEVWPSPQPPAPTSPPAPPSSLSPRPPANTVLPAIAGRTIEGQTLSAGNGAWTEAPTSYAYQWQDCDTAGANCVNIAGATVASYRLTAGDVGHTLRVTVTAVNAAGQASARSTASAVVSAVESTGLLVGSAAVQPSGDTDAAGSAEAFQYTAPAGGTVNSLSLYVNSGNTAPTIVVGLYSNAQEHPGTLLASATIESPVVGAWNTAGISLPVQVSAGSTYWLAALAPSGTLALRDIADGGDPTQNSAAESLTKLPASWASGLSWADSPASFYASENPPSSPPPLSAPANTLAPSVSGSAVEGQTLSASHGTWTESPTAYSYQWQDCNATGEGCVNVAGATSASHVLAKADVGHTLRVVVTATNGAGGTAQASSVTAVVVEAAAEEEVEEEEATGACTTTLTSSTSPSAIATAIVSAANGSTICLANGSYPEISVNGATHTSYVTIRPAPGATATLTEGLEVANSSFLRFEDLHVTGSWQGLNMRDTATYGGSHDYQFINDIFENDAYGIALDGAGNGPIRKVLIEGNRMRNIDWSGGACNAPGYADGQAVTLMDAEGVTVAHNVFKEVSWHFIQGGSAGPEGITVENNLFEGPIQADRVECTHLNVWQIFAGGEHDTFSNNIVRGEPGHPASITPVLFETETPGGKCTNTMSDSTISNNLFVYADAAYSIQVMTTQGLTVTNNTVVGSKYGTTVYSEAGCPDGTNYNVSRNIDVQNALGADISLGGCTDASCVFDYNVSDDSSAGSPSGTTHFVNGWTPSWETTSWNPASEPSPPDGYYIPTGLPFAAGYQGGGGP